MSQVSVESQRICKGMGGFDGMSWIASVLKSRITEMWSSCAAGWRSVSKTLHEGLYNDLRLGQEDVSFVHERPGRQK